MPLATPPGRTDVVDSFMRPSHVRRRPAPFRAGGANQVRIIGGEWRGRLLRFASSEGLRPTPDRVRETVFNWLGQDLAGLRCLDLFAGSGAFGFESLSRHAAEAVLVDRSRAVCESLCTSARLLGATKARIVCADALEFCARAGGPFDVVYVDPPYGHGHVERTLPLLPPLLARNARVYVESDRPPILRSGWHSRREGRAGAVRFQLITWGGHDESDLSRHV
jgi:16S rRNA (guanine966-N2)-methyltransferase